jgi:hypothetical protein
MANSYTWSGNVTPNGGTVSLGPITSTTNYHSIGAGGVGGGTLYTSATNPYTLISSNSNMPNAISVKGIMKADDLELDGVSMKESIQAILDRLSILVPDPAKLEKFAALKASYEHYKLLEKLCTDNPPNDDQV